MADKFESDIKIEGVMRDYIEMKYESPNQVDTSRQRGASRKLPLWKMYAEGDTYILPYEIRDSIGEWSGFVSSL